MCVVSSVLFVVHLSIDLRVPTHSAPYAVEEQIIADTNLTDLLFPTAGCNGVLLLSWCLLQLISIYALVALPWMLVSKEKDKGGFDAVTFVSVIALIGWALTMHIVFIIINSTMVWLLRMNLPEQKAVVIAASQKTLPFSVTVIGFLPEDAGSEGLMVIACIVAHLSQIVLDSILISYTVKEKPAGADSITDEAVFEEGVVLKGRFMDTEVRLFCAPDASVVDIMTVVGSDAVWYNGVALETKTLISSLDKAGGLEIIESVVINGVKGRGGDASKVRVEKTAWDEALPVSPAQKKHQATKEQDAQAASRRISDVIGNDGRLSDVADDYLEVDSDNRSRPSQTAKKTSDPDARRSHNIVI